MTDERDEQDVAESLDSEVLSDYDDDATGNLEYPPEEPVGVDEYGTTAAEERVDEPLAERVRREVPDLNERHPRTRRDHRAVGRLISPGTDDSADVYAIYSDDESDAIADAVDEADLSAEEAAIHVIPESSS